MIWFCSLLHRLEKSTVLRSASVFNKSNSRTCFFFFVMLKTTTPTRKGWRKCFVLLDLVGVGSGGL